MDHTLWIALAAPLAGGLVATWLDDRLRTRRPAQD